MTFLKKIEAPKLFSEIITCEYKSGLNSEIILFILPSQICIN